MSGDPTYDADDPPSPDEEPTKPMEGEPPVEPMAGGEHIQMESDEKVPRQVEAAFAWLELAVLRHQPDCALVRYVQSPNRQDIVHVPRCTCGVDQ